MIRHPLRDILQAYVDLVLVEWVYLVVELLAARY
jgi:hypothetical protein